MLFCTSCGSEIRPGARFCASCGAPAVDPEITRTAVASAASTFTPQRSSSVNYPQASLHVDKAEGEALPRAPDERTIFTVRPTMLYIKTGYALAALGAILLMAFLTYFGAPALLSILFALALLLIPAYFHLRRNAMRYTLTDSKIEIDAGLIARTTRNIPLRNIQDVTVSATVLQRLLGYGDVVIDNASEQSGKIVLHNIRAPRRHADMLLHELRRWR